MCVWWCLANAGVGARGQRLLLGCLGGKIASARHPRSAGEGGRALRGCPASLRPRTVLPRCARPLKPGFARTGHGQPVPDPRNGGGKAEGDPAGNTLSRHPGRAEAASSPPLAPRQRLCPPKRPSFSRRSPGNPDLGSPRCLSATVISVHAQTPTPAHATQTSKHKPRKESSSSPPSQANREPCCHYLYLSAGEALGSAGPCCASKSIREVETAGEDAPTYPVARSCSADTFLELHTRKPSARPSENVP